MLGGKARDLGKGSGELEGLGYHLLPANDWHHLKGERAGTTQTRSNANTTVYEFQKKSSGKD